MAGAELPPTESLALIRSVAKEYQPETWSPYIAGAGASAATLGPSSRRCARRAVALDAWCLGQASAVACGTQWHGAAPFTYDA